MTDPKHPLYDILREAFDAGIESGRNGVLAEIMQCEKPTFEPIEYGPTAGSILFPLAARMEAEIRQLVDDERAYMCVELAGCAGTIFSLIDEIKGRSLPSSPERET